MSQSSDPLDLSITLTPPPADSLPEVLATITLRCDPLGLSHTGDLLKDPLASQEREDLRWYLEEYWQWPFEGFAERGKRVEGGRHGFAARMNLARGTAFIASERQMASLELQRRHGVKPCSVYECACRSSRNTGISRAVFF